MNISGIAGAASATQMANVRSMASIKVLDMALSSFEDVAAQLIDSMSAAITGLGQNIDITV